MAEDRRFRLSEKDRQEVIRAIEKGDALDDRFRFLLFGDKRQVELVWNGKTTETCRVVLPFQTIERVDEPRAERVEETRRQEDMFVLDERGRQEGGWTNKLIWGDNKLILAALRSPQWREAIRAEGGLKLIYIDPPFDVGADFAMKVEVGEGGEMVEKKAGVLEQIAYRDTWGQGQDSFIAMLYERLSLMRDLLAEDGSIYVHCDWRVNSYIRLVLNEIFGGENFRNEIIWYYKNATMQNTKKTYVRNNQSILFYSKRENTDFTPPRYKEFTEAILNRFGRIMEENGEIKYKNAKGEKSLLTRVIPRFKKKYGRLPDDEDVIYKVEFPRISAVWDDVPQIRANNDYEHLGYPTQKPKDLLLRIIEASSKEGDLVADFFCGSGTLAEAAERTGRKWIASDLGKFAIHTTRKRMLKTQRDLKEESQSYRAFEILNLGKYERQFYLNINPNLNEEQQEQQRTEQEKNYLEMILKAYRARPLPNAHPFHGEKNGRMVVVGPISHPVTRHDLNDLNLACQARKITGVDVLGFEFEMGLAAQLAENTLGKTPSIKLKYIPAEVFDKRVVEKNEVTFYDPAYIEAIVHIEKDKAQKSPLPRISPRISVELKNFVNAYDTSAYNSEDLACLKEWHDWIDYWSVDYDYESKREIVRIYEPDSEDYKEQETGSYIFENEWQDFRTKQKRKILLATPYHDAPRERFKVAVKVVDIFGNDTMALLPVDTKKAASKKTTDKKTTNKGG